MTGSTIALLTGLAVVGVVSMACVASWLPVIRSPRVADASSTRIGQISNQSLQPLWEGLVLWGGVSVGVIGAWMFLGKPYWLFPDGISWVGGGLVVVLLESLVLLRPRGRVFWRIAQAVAIGVVAWSGLRLQIARFPLWLNLAGTVFWWVLICRGMDVLKQTSRGVMLVVPALLSALVAIGWTKRALPEEVMAVAFLGGVIAWVSLTDSEPREPVIQVVAALLGFWLAMTAILMPYAMPRREVALLTPLVLCAVPLVCAFLRGLKPWQGGVVDSKFTSSLSIAPSSRSLQRLAFITGCGAWVMSWASNIGGGAVLLVCAATLLFTFRRWYLASLGGHA